MKRFIQQLAFLLIGAFLLSNVAISCKDNNTSNQNSVSNGEYTSKMSKSDKKLYYDGSQNVVYEVKYKEDGFKLRTPSSDLIWKVKLYEDKIKISDNEENTNPWEIKILSPTEAKLVKNEDEIARLMSENNQSTVITYEDGATPLDIAGEFSSTYLVNAINDIPKDQQNILISELKEKGY